MKKLLFIACLMIAFTSLIAIPDANAGRVHGRLVRTDGSGIGNAIVKNFWGFFVRTDANGYFNYALICGWPTLTARAEGLNDLDLSASSTALGIFEDRNIGTKTMYLCGSGTLATQKTKTYIWPAGGLFCTACQTATPEQGGNPSGTGGTTRDPACQ